MLLFAYSVFPKTFIHCGSLLYAPRFLFLKWLFSSWVISLFSNVPITLSHFWVFLIMIYVALSDLISFSYISFIVLACITIGCSFHLICGHVFMACLYFIILVYFFQSLFSIFFFTLNSITHCIIGFYIEQDTFSLLILCVCVCVYVSFFFFFTINRIQLRSFLLLILKSNFPMCF